MTQEIEFHVKKVEEEMDDSDFFDEESSEDELMNEDLGVSVFEHGCEHGDYAW